MKAVILAYRSSVAKYRRIITLSPWWSEDANEIGCKSGEYGQFGYKLDARPASGAAALRHKTRVARGRRAHQQLPWCIFRQHRCRNRPPPRFRIRRMRQKRCRRDRGRNRSNGRIKHIVSGSAECARSAADVENAGGKKRVDNAGSRSAAPARSARRRAWACSRASSAATRARF